MCHDSCETKERKLNTKTLILEADEWFPPHYTPCVHILADPVLNSSVCSHGVTDTTSKTGNSEDSYTAITQGAN